MDRAVPRSGRLSHPFMLRRGPTPGITQQSRHPHAVEAHGTRGTRSSRWASASTRCGRPSFTSSISHADLAQLQRPGHHGLRPAGRHGRCRPRSPIGWSIDIDGDGSFQMNIQELSTLVCEKLPVKVFLLNNQHLGMVVQWEDRFMKGNRAHTYLGPIDKPEWSGEGDGIGDMDAANRYADFVGIAKAYGCGGGYVEKPEDLEGAINEMIDYDGPYVLEARSLPGARPADDPRRYDRQGHDHGVSVGSPTADRRRP